MITITAEEYQEINDSYGGICLGCEEHIFGNVEPDAEGYECECCGEAKVMGIEMALIAGELDIVDGEVEA